MPSSRANPDSFGSAPGSLHSSAMAPAAGAGDTLAERYRLDREGVRTEAGVLFDALDLDLNRRVAVEIASSIEEPKARRKWARDATLAQRLEGAHVLRVLDVGDVDGVPYAVRDATLCTMAAEIEVKDAVPIPLAVAWTLEACEAVAEAHALGMAHGDLRLDNIYLVRGTTEPTVKVAWTSAAKAERAAKEDIARDLAGLGVLLRVLATGRFGDDEADGAPTLPTELAHAVARALAVDPREKLQNVAELARMIGPFAPPGHPSARNVAFLMSRAGIVSGTIPGSPPSSRRPTRRARPAFAFVSAALIALVLGGSWFLWQNGKLPRWTGAAPPDAIGNTEVTSAPAAAVEPAAVEPTAVEPTNAAPATGTSTTTTTPLPTKRHAVEPKANSGAELRYADPPTTPTPATPTPVTTTPSTAAPAPLDEPTPSTVSAPAAPTTTAPAPELVPSETQPASPTTD
jgi:cell division septation protein DedD